MLNSVKALSRQIAAGPAEAAHLRTSPNEKPAWVKRLGPFGAIGVLLLKFKWAALFLLTKGKLLLLGLTNFKAHSERRRVPGNLLGDVWLVVRSGLRAFDRRP